MRATSWRRWAATRTARTMDHLAPGSPGTDRPHCRSPRGYSGAVSLPGKPAKCGNTTASQIAFVGTHSLRDGQAAPPGAMPWSAGRPDPGRQPQLRLRRLTDELRHRHIGRGMVANLRIPLLEVLSGAIVLRSDQHPEPIAMRRVREGIRQAGQSSHNRSWQTEMMPRYGRSGRAGLPCEPQSVQHTSHLRRLRRVEIEERPPAIAPWTAKQVHRALHVAWECADLPHRGVERERTLLGSAPIPRAALPGRVAP